MTRELLIPIYMFLCLLFISRLVLANGKDMSTHHEDKLALWGSYSRAIRSKLVKVNQALLSEPAASLVSGVLWGEKETFSQSAKSALRQVGLSHIVVASGMNLVLLSGVLYLILKPVPKYRSVIFLFLILIYTFITGFDPPILRAAVMVITVSLAQILGRPVRFYWPLILAGYLLILLSPQIISLISFQLSFLAMTGQVFLGFFSDKFKLLSRFLIADLSQTVGAQLFTLPILVANFGNYSLVSILANVLVLWTVPWLMGLGLVAGIIGTFSTPIGRMSALPSQALSFYFWTVVGIFSNHDWNLIRFKFTDPVFYLGYYLLLFGIMGIFMKKLSVK